MPRLEDIDSLRNSQQVSGRPCNPALTVQPPRRPDGSWAERLTASDHVRFTPQSRHHALGSI